MENIITGTITSSVLLKVILTKEGSAPFIVDDTTAKK
jgi:hypothetical protein